MKIKIVLLFILFALMLNANAVSLQFKPSFTITRQDSSGIYVINYLGSKTGKIILRIMDMKKDILVTRYLNDTKDFSLPINFSSMQEGSYTIEIDDGSDKVINDISYSNPTQPTYSHIIKLGENRYLFTSSHVGNQKIIIRIFDETSGEIYNEEKIVDGNLAVVFNVKNILGSPTFEVFDASGRSLMVPASPYFVTVKKSNHLSNIKASSSLSIKN